MASFKFPGFSGASTPATIPVFSYLYEYSPKRIRNPLRMLAKNYFIIVGILED
jgi:hypothetical protein